MHDVPVEIRYVVPLNESSAQGLRLSPQGSGIGVVKVQVKPAPSFGRFVDLLERQLGKTRFGWTQPDKTFVLR